VSTNGSCVANFYRQIYTATVGDIWIARVAARPASSNGFFGSSTPAILGFTDATTSSGYSFTETTQPDNYQNWEYVWAIQKITGASGNSEAIFNAVVDQTTPTEYYAPLLIKIPAGQMTDSQALAFAQSLGTYSPQCSTGSLCGVNGPIVNPDGSLVTKIGGFSGTFTFSNSANRVYTFPDASGHVALVDAPQTWTAPQTFDSASLVDPTIDGQTLSAVPSAIYSSFLPGDLSISYTASTITLDHNIVVTRIEVTLKTAPMGCSSNAVVRLNGSTILDSVLDSAVNDSGPIDLAMDQSIPVQVILETPAAGCAATPRDANVVIQYRTQ
jgi:hypothetical protein